jgi:GNAT superfamily N-acetyltransferase
MTSSSRDWNSSVNWIIARENGSDLDMDAVMRVYRDSGLGERRPMDAPARMASMVGNANLVMTCRIEGELVGLARSISDFSYVTYLSDIAVARAHQRSGIGRELMAATRDAAPDAKIVLLSAPAAASYYPHLGFTQHGSAWVMNP